MEQLPQNLEAERNLITTLALSPDYWRYAQHLTPDFFLDTKCRDAFRQMREHINADRSWLADDEVTAEWYLLGTSAYFTEQFQEIVKRVEEANICRIGYLAAKEIAKAALNGDSANVEKVLISTKLPSVVRNIKTVPDIARTLKDNMGKSDYEIVPSGFPNLDSVGMLRRKEGFGLAARPAMGKSQFLAQVGANVAENGVCVVWSGEMAAERWVGRIVSAEAGTSYRYASEGDPRFDYAFDKTLHMDGLYIYDQPMSSRELWGQCRRIADKEGQLDLVIVDHIRLLQDDHASEVQRLGIITKNLRDIAKELNCCSAMCIQLNRMVEHRDDKHPDLMDLRDSGQIEENLDTIVFLYREDYYKRKNDPNEQEGSGVAELYTRKNREGRQWKKRLYFNIDDGPRFASMMGE